MTRQVNEAGIALIKRFEGLRLEAYQDQGGVPTIGYGHCRGVKLGATCTEEQAEAWLARDVAAKAAQVDTATFDVPTTDNEFAAMACLAFNIGTGNFAQSTVLKKHRAGDVAGAADAFLLWSKVTVDGSLVESPGLLARRQAERALYLTP